VFFNERPEPATAIGTLVIIASGIYIVLREGTPSVSENRPVLESRSRAEIGVFPRISSLLKRR
jgi:S-adenosylmethionine uptake transporter